MLPNYNLINILFELDSNQDRQYLFNFIDQMGIRSRQHPTATITRFVVVLQKMH